MEVRAALNALFAEFFALPTHWKYEFFGIVFGVMGLAVGGVTFLASTSTPASNHTTISAQVAQVSESLAAIEQISASLQQLKADLQKTDSERARVEAEAKHVSELKALNEQQLETLRSALEHRTTRQIIADNLLSFFLGVFSSLLASFIFVYMTRAKTNRDAAETGAV